MPPASNLASKTAGAATPKGDSASAISPNEYEIFVSTEKEPVSFNLGNLPAMRWEGERLAWRVPRKDAHLYMRHHWCEIGRVRPLNQGL